MDDYDIFGYLLVLAMFACIPVYFVWQAVIPFYRRGLALWLSLLPILPMGATVMFVSYWLERGSNLAPMALMFVAPFCVLWLWIAGLFSR